MSPTRTVRAVAGLLAALVLLLLGGATASAHDVVESSDPAEGTALAAAPARVSVTLSEAPQGPNAITVVGPDGRHYEQGAATVEGETVSVGVAPLGPAGRYEMGYRIVSSDGHPVSGAVPFSLTAPGPGAAPSAGSGSAVAAPPAGGATAAQQPSPAAASPAPASSESDTGGVPAWPFVVLAVVVVAGAVALALRRRAS